MKPTEMTSLEYQDGGKSSVQDFTSSDRGKPWQQNNFFYLSCARTRKEHWTWRTKMAAMTSKYNFGCVIHSYSDQWYISLANKTNEQIRK